MTGFIDFADRLSIFVGKLFAWTIVALTAVVCVEVFMRYVVGRPTSWAFDMSYILYGAGFMMAGAYALARNAHVRADFLYRSWRPTTQARLDIVLYLLFFFPGVLAFIWFGWEFAEKSWRLNERSPFSPTGPVIWPLKMTIPVTGVLLLIQGAAEVMRCVICVREGQWPARLHDVEELEKQLAEEVQAAGADALDFDGHIPEQLDEEHVHAALAHKEHK
jgi:TRAP-type mannitol/chloroaromatic compound transport system permease small subunit